MADLKIRIVAHTLANALKYGKANPGNVLPKIIGEFPEVKKDIPALRAQIDEAVAQANSQSAEAQRARLEAIAPELLEKKEHKERELPPLPHAVEGKVVTRIPPEPSKYNHLGHALSFLINTIYAERYQGKTVLRFEDTNPEKENQEYVDAMMQDITEYLGIKPSAIRFVSDDMPQLAAYAAQLIERDGAYMCFCDQESMRKGREEGTACACRSKPAAEQLHAWQEFQAGAYPKGTAVLRFKGDMQSQNTVMRDPVLYRTVDTPHFRQGSKYKVWPTYDFYNPIEDSLCGITHILRSNEFELRIEVHQHIKRILGLDEQHVLQYGRIGITGATTQGREIRELIESGTYIGWDDPRLVTLKALKRRGIRREAYIELVKSLGLSPHPVSLDFTMLAAANRKLVENVDRYAFVADPVEIIVEGAAERDLELDLHPQRKGGRVMKVNDRFLVAGADHAQFAGKRIRLMGNLTYDADTGKLLQYEQKKGGHDLIIHWVAANQNVPVEVMMPDATIVTGVAEAGVAHVQVDAVIQFERFGFCRFDRFEDGTYHFWYTHK